MYIFRVNMFRSADSSSVWHEKEINAAIPYYVNREEGQKNYQIGFIQRHYLNEEH